MAGFCEKYNWKGCMFKTNVVQNYLTVENVDGKCLCAFFSEWSDPTSRASTKWVLFKSQVFRFLKQASSGAFGKENVLWCWANLVLSAAPWKQETCLLTMWSVIRGENETSHNKPITAKMNEITIRLSSIVDTSWVKNNCDSWVVWAIWVVWTVILQLSSCLSIVSLQPQTSLYVTFGHHWLVWRKKPPK